MLKVINRSNVDIDVSQLLILFNCFVVDLSLHRSNYLKLKK